MTPSVPTRRSSDLAPSTKAGANAGKRGAQPSPGSTGGDSAETAPMPGMDHSAMGKSAGSRMASKAPAQQAGEDSHASHGGSGNTPGDAMKSDVTRSDEHTSELQSLMRLSYVVLCSANKNTSDS